ncbi:SusC/RagA family TonB-linked outer membrane protein [Mucilaginibacter arboris]|uniref:SusC/RagA family TonB-linked outer membrane protein n=1 Tax=Mucilaginibacter arboris TaxID=2682090 RepID=A0A7K1STT6_9SPHI|nr:TonB-dependent receptor [Mucilaginibacter arboris]MVN20725.1 SusC/RagA family TonB-linked outer membrane protein [Mucilaginibacter arboris]
MKNFYQKWLRLFLSVLFLSPLFYEIALAQTQNIKVTGIVKDKQGLTLIGVSVKVKGTNLGTQTDAAGKFTLNVPQRSVLDFSYIGFLSLEKAVPANGILNITLFDDAKNLSEVVVVGYGTQKRKDITGSVVSVDPKRLESLPNNNLAQAIEGSVPGLTVTQSGGGAEGTASIQIRGQRSITASNNPLVILDGIPYNGNLTDINPSDIGSIEILKDASAAAIYGSRGANGVILVTTKTGTSGKPVVAYDGSFGVDKFTKIPAVLTPQQFYAYKMARNPGAITPSETAIYNSGNFANYVDLAVKNGTRQQNAVSVRGGTDNSKYFVSLNYLDVNGVDVNDHFKRLSTTANLNVNITKWLTYGTSTRLGFDNRSGMPASLSGDYSAFTFNPLTTPFQTDGVTPTIYPWPETVYYANPLAPTLVNNSDLEYQIYSTNFLEVKLPLKGLTYRINTGVTHSSRDQNSYYGRNTKTGLEAQGRISDASNVSNSYTIENILNYNREFGKHTLGFTALYSYENDIVTNHTLTATGFPNDVLTYYQARIALLTSVDVPASGAPLYAKTSLLSQMGRFNYSYDSRYLLTATVRRDGASDFGADKKYGIFPSVALGWNISNEQFMKNIDQIDNLKLRLSYGSNGNQAVAAYSTFASLGNATYLNGSATAPGYIPSTLANPDLHWETTNTLNGGLDFGILKGRIQGSVDIYSAKTHDLLLNRSIPSTNGISNIIQNIGKTANKGIDIGITSTNIKSKDFTWTSTGTFSLNRNKIVDLYGTGKSDTANNWFIGHPIRVNFGYKYLGVWQLTDDLTKSPQPNTQAGYAKVADLNGDGKITGPDRTIIGSLQPLFTYGLANTFAYKNISLYAFVQGVAGVIKQNTTLSDNVNTAVEKNTYAKNYWTPTNPTNDYYANAQLQASPIYQPNIYGVAIFQNASYLRVKDLLLSYSFSPKLLERLKISKIKLFVEGRNLFTITPWKGFDPELDASNTSIPILIKEFVAGLNVSL